MFYFVDHHIISHLIIHVFTYPHYLGVHRSIIDPFPPQTWLWGCRYPQMHMFSVVAGLTADAEHAVQGASEWNMIYRDDKVTRINPYEIMLKVS